MAILGISAFYHDSAAAIIDKNGSIIAAAQEERFTREKHDSGFPKHAIEYCLSEAGIRLTDLEFIAFYDKPFLKFERLLETYIAFAPRGFRSFALAMPVWMREKLFLKSLLGRGLRSIDDNFKDYDKILFSEHHYSHAASAYFPSPFDEAVVLTIDGVGEWATTSVAIGRGRDLSIVKEIHFPHSLGLLYSAFTYYLGFKVNSGEYKVMGLAPYGAPKFAKIIFEHVVHVEGDGSFSLNMKYFEFATGLRMTNSRFACLFGQPVRKAGDDLTEFHMDIAASVQAVVETIILKLVRNLAGEFDIDNLCLAGGVALNCVANGKILRDGAFKKMWVQPAAGDAGGSLGAALAAHHQHLARPRPSTGKDQMKGSYLGPWWTSDDLENRLAAEGAKFERLEDDALIRMTAGELADGKAVGWMQGRMEFGPRALGGRSILGDPRSPTMQKNLNLKVKFRESFRPFAPSILVEDVSEWFELNCDSPYMLLVANVSSEIRRIMTTEEEGLFGIDKLNVVRSTIPAVTHVDYSARVQTVHAETNPKYYALLKEFKNITGCPILINTSFNVRGEPIVCTPEDAFRCFMGNGLDTLIIGNLFLRKSEQDPKKLRNYQDEFDLD